MDSQFQLIQLLKGQVDRGQGWPSRAPFSTLSPRFSSTLLMYQKARSSTDSVTPLTRFPRLGLLVHTYSRPQRTGSVLSSGYQITGLGY